MLSFTLLAARKYAMPKAKPNKGLLKRIRISKTGKIRFQRAGGRHLRSHKPGSRLRGYRKPAFVGASDVGRIQGMLHISVTSMRRKASEPAASEE
jgi:ribosomal protein L35